MYVVLVDVQAELRVDVGDQREAVDVGRSVGARDDARPRARRARELADDALHQRLERDEPGGAAVLVDDQRFAHAAAPHFGEQIVGASVSGTVSASRASDAGVDRRRRARPAR